MTTITINTLKIIIFFILSILIYLYITKDESDNDYEDRALNIIYACVMSLYIILMYDMICYISSNVHFVFI